MGSTRHFGIGFFDFGTPLGTDFSGQVEIDRFVFLDRMLFGLMSIFGNGVVSGWTLTAQEAFTVSINEGFGNINFMSGRTTFPSTVDSIPANSTVYIYAKTKAITTFTEEVEFLFHSSSTLAESDFNFLLLSKVTAGATGIESIDDTVRQEIGFIELIKAAIRLHKHRGGSLNPSKIDLASEVKGQLPSFRIADFDAEKLSTGTLSLPRIPLLDHQDLQNVGLLGHAQLDTFVKTLEASNTELFGEIGTANLLQLIIAAKLIYEDPDSAFFTGTQIDENMIDEFVVIPGITSNDRIDFDNSTATIDVEQHFIKGVPPTTGTSFFVTFDTALAWRAQTLDKLTIAGDSVALAFDEEQDTLTEIVEGFESSTEPNQDLTDSGIGLFKEQSIIQPDLATIESDSSSTNTTEGFFSGEFSHKQSLRVQFVKEFSPAKDWSSFDSFNYDVKCIALVHGAVKLYFTNSSGDKSPDFTVLDVDETTDSATSGFEFRTIDLTAISFSNDIASFVIYSDDHTTDFTYFIDNINIQRALLLPEEGTLKVRYSTGAAVVFSMLEWTSTEPPGTEIEVRARSANGSVLLNRATFTGSLNSGDAINLEGTDLEVEMTFLPDSDRLPPGPTLQSLKILVLTDAEIDGFAIDTSDEFARGTSENTVISSNAIQLDTPIFVDSIYFMLQNNMNQGTISSSGVFESGNEPSVLGTQDSPISPNQVFKAVEDSQSNVSKNFCDPRSVRRQTDRSFIIADTYNDRVLQYDEDANLLSGVGSINYEANTTFPIAASVDIRTGILYIVWSKNVSFSTVNLSKVIIQTSTQTVQLIKDFDKILGKTTDELTGINASGQIMPVFLSVQNAGLASALPKDSFLQVGTDVITGTIDNLSIFYTTAATGLGIPCYVGNFAYIDGIFSPTWADKSLSKGFIIGNGTIAVPGFNFSGNADASGATATKNTNVSSIIEVDKNNNVVFGSNIMNFSPFFPGRVQEIDSTTLLIGGIRPGSTGGTIDASFNFRSLSTNNTERSIQKDILKGIFFPDSSPHVGAVILFDKSIKTTLFEYTSAEGIIVSDVDIDSLGQYVIAESSLDRSGRVIKIDTSGNVVFSVGEGTYSLINDVSVQFDDSILIST